MTTRTLTALSAVFFVACDLGETETEYQVGNREVEVERDRQTGEITDVDTEYEWYDWGYGVEFDDWDLDESYTLDWDEYHTGWTEAGLFRDWDLDNDGWLTEDEIGTGLFNDWEVDNDGWLDVDEYRWGIRGWDYGDAVWGNYGAWDVDDDHRLTQAEFVDRWKDTTIFELWNVDADEYVSADEMARGAYNMWDTDGDGLIDTVEYRF